MREWRSDDIEMDDWAEVAAKLALDINRLEKKCAPSINDEVSE